MIFVERLASVTRYKGVSRSRLDGSSLGSGEYSYKGWRWPEGLAHYIAHGVKPSDEFIEFIEHQYRLDHI